MGDEERLLVYAWPDGSELSAVRHGGEAVRLSMSGPGLRIPLEVEINEMGRIWPSRLPLIVHGDPFVSEDAMNAVGGRLVGFALDAGLPRWTEANYLVEPFLVPYPRFVPDDEWEDRYRAASRALEPGPKALDLLDYLLGYTVEAISTGKWRASWWGGNVTAETPEDCLDRAVEKVQVVPASSLRGWEEEHGIVRGAFSPDVASCFHLLDMLGEPRPLGPGFRGFLESLFVR